MTERTFKTAWFAKAARKARISDADLCKAIEQVALGQADDLGGGVFKKRLNDNRHRSIILAKTGRFWVYEYVFAKRTGPTLTTRNLPNSGSWLRPTELTDRQIERLVSAGDFLEICHDQKQ